LNPPSIICGPPELASARSRSLRTEFLDCSRVRLLRRGSVPGGFKEEFTGSYRIVEDYLGKKQLLSREFVDAHSEFLYLASDIADHFWHLAQALPNAAIASLPDAERDACRLAIERVAADAKRLAE
jgi:hypothetical protein